jgi:hypothetical protein
MARWHLLLHELAHSAAYSRFTAAMAKNPAASTTTILLAFREVQRLRIDAAGPGRQSSLHMSSSCAGAGCNIPLCSGAFFHVLECRVCLFWAIRND